MSRRSFRLSIPPVAPPAMAKSFDEKLAATHPPRSTLTTIVLIGTVTIAQILNVRLAVLHYLYRPHFHEQLANIFVAAISLPTIGRDLDITEANLQWLVSAYSLSSVRAFPSSPQSRL